MLKCDLHPPRSGPNADPVLYGIAAGLAELFPPVMDHGPFPPEQQGQCEPDSDREPGERD